MGDEVITVAQVTPEVKQRVIAILDTGISPRAIRIASTGVAFEGFKKANPELVVETREQRLQNQQAISNYVRANRAHYVAVVLEIYANSIIEEVVDEIFGSQSSPDGTGNSLDLEQQTDYAVPGAVCPICKEVHN